MEIQDKIAGENVRNYAYRTILHNILTLELPPGSAVSENELSDSLKISRTPVREALLEMRRLDLVESFPQKGSYVTRIDYDLIDVAHFIRSSLEISVVRLACRQGISSEYAKLLKDNLERQKWYENGTEVHYAMMELDNAFHRLLFESVQKLPVYECMQTQMVHFDRLRNVEFFLLKEEKNKRTVDDHENILYAIMKQDEELAEMIMVRHLSRHLGEKEKLLRLRPDFFKEKKRLA